jgi:hypothetical protein
MAGLILISLGRGGMNVLADYASLLARYSALDSKDLPFVHISQVVKEAQLATFDSLIVFSVSCLICLRLETAQKGEKILTRRPHSNVAAVRFRAPKVVILARSVE